MAPLYLCLVDNTPPLLAKLVKFLVSFDVCGKYICVFFVISALILDSRFLVAPLAIPDFDVLLLK